MEDFLERPWPGHENHLIDAGNFWKAEKVFIMCIRCKVVLAIFPMVRCGVLGKRTGTPCKSVAAIYLGHDRCRLHREGEEATKEDQAREKVTT